MSVSITSSSLSRQLLTRHASDKLELPIQAYSKRLAYLRLVSLLTARSAPSGSHQHRVRH
jgi:hypothetical protein